MERRDFGGGAGGAGATVRSDVRVNPGASARATTESTRGAYATPGAAGHVMSQASHMIAHDPYNTASGPSRSQAIATAMASSGRDPERIATMYSTVRHEAWLPALGRELRIAHAPAFPRRLTGRTCGRGTPPG